MLHPHKSTQPALRFGWVDALTTHRRAVLLIAGMILLAGFNGVWRVGSDSALYLSLAESLARGEGFAVNGVPDSRAYPALPWLLSLPARLGVDPVLPVLLLFNALAIGTVLLTYQLAKSILDRPLAVLAALGVASNALLGRHANEVMTDVPQVFLVLVTLLALERVARPGRHRWINLIWVGLALLAMVLLRPTAWVMVLALAMWGGAVAIRTRSWPIVFIVLCATLALAGFVAIDPLNLMGGQHMQDLAGQLVHLPDVLANEVPQVLQIELPTAFMSQSMGWFGIVVSINLLISMAVLMRVRPAWALTAIGLIALTFIFSNPPRYYLMIMPILWIGWLLALSKLAPRIPDWVGGVTIFCLIFTPIVLNVGKHFGLIYEQRHAELGGFDRTSREAAFYRVYENGVVLNLQTMAQLINDNVPVGQRVLVPHPRILSYLSGRTCVSSRELLDQSDAAHHPAQIRKARIPYAIWPAQWYQGVDDQIRALIIQGHIRTGTVIAESKDGSIKLTRPAYPRR